MEKSLFSLVDPSQIQPRHWHAKCQSVSSTKNYENASLLSELNVAPSLESPPKAAMWYRWFISHPQLLYIFRVTIVPPKYYCPTIHIIPKFPSHPYNFLLNIFFLLDIQSYRLQERNHAFVAVWLLLILQFEASN